MIAPSDRYQARMRRVLEYIEAHLDEDLTVEGLSSVAAFSRFHFQRQFAELCGVSLFRYVQLLRLKRASWQLAFRGQKPVLQIALASGYEAPEAFARAFGRHLRQTPSSFRIDPQWTSWHETFEPLIRLRSQYMQTGSHATEVRVVHRSEVKVGALEHRGDPRLLGQSIRRFIEWRQANRLPPRVSGTYNIVYDNPCECAPEDYRFDICAAVTRDVDPNPWGVITKIIPGGRCAVLRHAGSDDLLGQTIARLYGEWLPSSGEELRDFPLYLQRVAFFPDVPECEVITDVFLPIR